MKLLTPLFALLPLSGCVLVSHRTEFDHHVDHSFAVEAWPAAGLVLESDMGTVRVLPTRGADRLDVRILEREPGDGDVTFEGGRLVLTVRPGGKAALGDVTLHASGALPALTLDTGLGDVVVSEVEVHGDVVASTGMGDVRLVGVQGADALTGRSGLGSVEARGLRCRRLTLDSGMGDVRVDRVEADEAKLDTGLGAVTLRSSTFQELAADTGMGNVSAKDTEWTRGSLDTGLGNVSKR